MPIIFLPRGVVIDKYPDKIVLKNPGTAIVGKKQMLRGGDSEPRNANIMKMLNLIGFGEHAGSGVPDIFETWETSGLSEPVVEECFGENSPSKMFVTSIFKVVSEPQFYKSKIFLKFLSCSISLISVAERRFMMPEFSNK